MNILYFEVITLNQVKIYMHTIFFTKSKLEPLFNPNVTGDLDLKNFDPKFVKESIHDTPPVAQPSSGGKIVVNISDNVFKGFTYSKEDTELHSCVCCVYCKFLYYGVHYLEYLN